MSKYSYAKSGIELALGEACAGGVEEDEVLLAMIVSAVDAYAKSAGKDAARQALTYELDNIGGSVDTVFLRSR